MIHPIPTTYRGVTFRSRLEARWAVFFDALGIEWHYEHEGYQLPSGWYLPDFWLPSVHNGSHVEIKPTDDGHGSLEHLRCGHLAIATGRDVFMIHGEVSHNGGASPGYSAYWFGSGDADPGYTDLGYLWCICEKCNRIDLAFEGRGERVCGARCYPDRDKGYSDSHPRLLAAYEAARTARFW